MIIEVKTLRASTGMTNRLMSYQEKSLATNTSPLGLIYALSLCDALNHFRILQSPGRKI